MTSEQLSADKNDPVDSQPLILLGDRYKVLSVLGDGGFGQTFLVEDTHMPSNRRCVLKQLQPVHERPELRQMVEDRFQREAATLEMLGDASYAIYLGHLFVVVPMGVLWTRMTWVHSDISSVAFVLMALMGSCWLGTFLHHYFDQPLQRRLARSRNPYLRGATIESR